MFAEHRCMAATAPADGDTKVNKSPKSLLPKAAVTVGRQTKNKYIHKSL